MVAPAQRTIAGLQAAGHLPHDVADVVEEWGEAAV